MSRQNLQEVVARQVCRTRIKVAVAGCGASIAVDVPELRVIEDVERFRAEFESNVFLDGEVFEQRHIDIGAVGIAQRVPASISKRESGR